MTILFKPTVGRAIRGLESALRKLEDAEVRHQATSDELYEQANQLCAKAQAEEEASDRANRIRTKLAELLS